MKNTKHIKIMTVFGTRPEIIRLCRILPKLDQYFDHKTVFTGQSFSYELSDIFFKELEIRKPNYILNVKADSLGQQIANILSQTEKVFLKEKPDALLVLGDTNSALVSILAKRLKILVFHMEAGNRSFDWNVPEEINRRIIDHISDYNLCYTTHAKNYLVNEGIAPQTVFVTGSPLAEVYKHFANMIESSTIVKDLKLVPKKYFLVSTHREENVDNPKVLKELFSSINHLSDKYDVPVIVSLHPRTKKRLIEQKIKTVKKVHLLSPFGHFEYNKLQKEALCVISDSGSIQEESAIVNFRAIQIRVSTERPEAFDAGSIIVVGFNKDTILQAVEMVLKEDGDEEKEAIIPQNYIDTNVSNKVAKLILGLTSIKKHHGRTF